MKNKTYTFYEIESYLSGKMSAEDMYEMEKNALSDPFLNAAIEGYRSLPIANFEEIEQINAKILGHASYLKPHSTPKNNLKSLKFAAIAASFIIGTGVMGYYFNQKTQDNHQSIANTPIENIQNNQQTTIENTDNQQNTEIVHDKSVNTDSKSIAKKNSNTQIIDQDFTSNASKKLKTIDNQAVLTEATKNTPSNLIIENSSAEEEMVVKNKNTKPAEVPKQYFGSPKNNSNLSKADIAKNENTPSQNLLSKNSLMENAHAQPLGGWVVFVQNIQFRLGNLAEIQNSYVKLKFKIQNGEPDDFQILHSPNDQIAQQTIDIIRTGPKWKTIGKSKSAEVSIQLN